jgi:hypothetical protein
MDRGCSMSAITNQCRQPRLKKWTNLSDRRIITGIEAPCVFQRCSGVLPESLTPKSVHGHRALCWGDCWWTEGCLLSRREKWARKKTILHFDNAPMRSTRTVMRQLQQSGFKRMDYPACSLDLSRCDFFLFGYMKERLKERSFYRCFLDL